MSLLSGHLLLIIAFSKFVGISSCGPRNLKPGLNEDENGRFVPVCRNYPITGEEYAVLTSFEATQRRKRASISDEIFSTAEIQISSLTGTSEIDAEAVRIVTSGKFTASRVVIGTVTSGGPRESRKPTLLAMDNFFFRGGIELNHQIYFFHCLTSPISVNRLLGIFTEANFDLLELKLSEPYHNGTLSQKMIVVRGLGKNKGMLVKENFASLSGISMVGGVNLRR
ncbi:uncharacterized protein LOC118435557 isoform X2 [Folsomia candida]|uniref:Uncharacterized protein n=1 Tax=Folsomia candida TaxID=158441 RepID=A0A226EA61_FOLCA|nr:uncharacterized protein LOC118435557 isoform X2 [Folsomia candida]OXA54393.1 hypothetical protein Fcan01_10910 [Folsomia candida]